MHYGYIYSWALKNMQQKSIFQIVAGNGGGPRRRGRVDAGEGWRGADMGNGEKRCD